MARPVGRVISASRLKDRVLNYSFPEDIGPHGLLMIFRNYRYEPVRGVLNSTPVPVTGSSVLLPLPRQIIDNTGLRLTTADLGIMGEIAATTMANGGGAIEAAQKALASLLPDPNSLMTSLSGMIQGGRPSEDFMQQLNFLARRVSQNLVDTRALDAGLGNAINPKQALTFQGVNMKEYDFDFEFMPKSQEESNKLRDIGNLLRANALPSFGDLTIGGTELQPRVFLEYPSTVDLFFVGVDSSYYFYFKTAMISRIGLNFAPTGGNQHAILRGGKPAYVTLNISFQEMDIRVREEYEQELIA